MSSFTWGILKVSHKVSVENYSKGDILVFFNDKENVYLSKKLDSNEIFFNIACGYDKMIKSTEKNAVNHDDFFNIYRIEDIKQKIDLQTALGRLRERLKGVQNVLCEIFEQPFVEQMKLFHTDTGNEISLESYVLVDWGLESFAENFWHAIIERRGFSPTIKVIFCKEEK